MLDGCRVDGRGAGCCLGLPNDSTVHRIPAKVPAPRAPSNSLRPLRPCAVVAALAAAVPRGEDRAAGRGVAALAAMHRFVQPLRHLPHKVLHALQAVVGVVGPGRFLLGPDGVEGRGAAEPPDGFDVGRAWDRALHDLDGARHAGVAFAEAHRRVHAQGADKAVPTIARSQVHLLDNLHASPHARKADHVLHGGAVDARELRDEQIQ
mmetsp:Transcript_67399/g.195194  ORF Transcript_67399/g.195194 Transcript_67399/m.195194 type:complete len:207 (+) Transcript_67399:311-931(+)